MVLALADIVAQSRGLVSPICREPAVRIMSSGEGDEMKINKIKSNSKDEILSSVVLNGPTTPEPSFGVLVQGFRDRHKINAKL